MPQPASPRDEDSTAAKEEWSPSTGNRLFRVLGRPVFRLLFHLLCRVQVEGLKNVPREGGYLVVINHISIYEPPLVLSFWPRAMEVAGAVEVLERPFQGDLMRLYGSLPVQRGTADRKLLRGMVRFLRQGSPVLIAPEGGRTHTPGMRQAWHGAAYVVGKAEVPLVPVGITGTESVGAAWKRWRRPLLRMVIGDPFTLPPIPWSSPERKKALQANTERLMRRIAQLMPPEYRGVYA